ncbi:MAG: replicative DNA helicase [Candidatus Parabeggiatoa sp.]|nr:replicative DNA helicase [Candidatus Parabeggiatoa sp.]
MTLNQTIPIPYSEEAERRVLGALMSDDNIWLSICDILSAPHFYLNKHQLIFKAIADLNNESCVADPITVSEHLISKGHWEKTGGGQYLATLFQNRPATANTMAYAQIIFEQWQRRQLIQIGNDLTDQALNLNGQNVSGLLETTEKNIFNLSQNINTDDKIKDLLSILKKTVAQIDDNAQNPNGGGLSSGFIELDQTLGGGFQKGELTIIAARPSMGKTAFALNIAEFLASSQHPVIVFSLEMSETQLAMRLLAARSNVNITQIRTGRLTDEQWPYVVKAMSDLENIPLFIEDSAGLSPTQLKTKLRRFIHKTKCQISAIVVDYLQLMQVAELKGERVNEISEISRSLKTIAKEFNIPVLALSQLNRSVESRNDKRPQMSDLRDSGAIEQDADVILFIYRDEVYNQNNDNDGIAEIIISKHRNGPTGMIKLNFLGATTQFTNRRYDDELS